MKAGMVALLPANPEALTVPGGTPADQMHLTLAFLGDDVTAWTDTRRRLLAHAVWSFAHHLAEPITARVMAHALFNPDGGPDQDRAPCQVYLVADSDRLAPARDTVDTTMRLTLGDDYPTQHEPFLPHITALVGSRNEPPAANLTFTGPVVFNRVALALAGDWSIAPITADPAEAIRPYARTAFAAGWARSGGPMTPTVKAASIAAVELAVANAAHPNVLEATLRLGSLEGTWALVYQRREALVAQHRATVNKLWQQAAHRLDVRAAVRRFRQSLGLGEAVDVHDTDHRRLVANGIATTVVSAVAGRDAKPEDRDAIVSATADGLADAQAEGYTGAVLVGAEQLGQAPPPADAVLADYQASAPEVGSHWADASGAVDSMVTGASHDLGGRLSAMADDGADFDAMVDGVWELIGSDSVRAVGALLDQAMGKAFTMGVLSLYGREGVTQVDFITAGGDRVCPICQEAENNSPWDRVSAPVPPLHPYCRCNLSATDPMQGLVSMLARYAAA